MNILQVRKENEKAKILAHLQAHGGKTVSQLRDDVPINIKRDAYAARLTELRKEGKAHCLTKWNGQGGGSWNVWYAGPQPEHVESMREIELPPLALAMGYRPITPQRGRHVEEAHSHSTWRGVAPGIQSGFSCVWPDHG